MEFNNTGAMRSPFSPRVRQAISGRRPIGLSSAKKNQSKFMHSPSEQAGDVVYKTPSIMVETYGLPLPVMVTELLTLGSNDVSVRMSECGWCWAVSGRRALLWPRALGPEDGPPGALGARELTLPQTDLAHRADLLMVFYADGAQMPSCVCVSPEGVVRYWACAAQDVHADVSCELGGQECARLVRAGGALLLATTTCTLVLIHPTTVDGRQTVSCRRLSPPSGWLGGIGRRVSLMFFGSMPAHADTKLVGVVCTGGSRDEPHAALVARGPLLQLWRGADLHEHAELLHAHLHGEGVSSRDVAALDVHSVGDDELLLLLAVTGPRQDRRYVIVHINISEPSRPSVRTVGVAGAGWCEGEEPKLLPLGNKALLYTPTCIALVHLSASNECVEFMRVGSEAERILCAERVRGRALLFSRAHGVMQLTAADAHAPSGCDSPVSAPCATDMYDGNLSLFEIDPHEISTVTSDACGKLKTAFLFHLRREHSASRSLLGELFPQREEDGDTDAALARTLVAVAREMLDDIPAGDPRWKPRSGVATNIPLGSSAALQVSAQLADKRRAFSLYADFLRATGLMQRAGTITDESGGVVRCETALCALAASLAAAAALRGAQDAGPPAAPLIELAIEQVVGNGSDEEDWVAEALASGALTAADVCYRRVSRVRAVLRALAAAPPANARAALHTATLLTAVLTEMHKVRAAWGCAPPPPALGPRALLPALVQHVKHSVNEHARTCTDASVRAQLSESAASLARAVLHEAAPLQTNPATEQVYTDMRRDLILTFVEEGGSNARALALADTFKDLELLVQLCVEHAGVHTLQDYIAKYENEGMAEIAFRWLSERGGRYAAMVARGVIGGAGAGGGTSRLGGWLRANETRVPLAALHALHTRRPRDAATLFAQMAAEPDGVNSLERATTAASLGKLCLLAGAGDDNPAEEAVLRAQLDRQLTLAEHQAALPRDLRLHRGLEGSDQPILTSEELVQLYIDSESSSLTEYDYKKALDLTDFIQDMERRDELRLRVWCACIRRDSWSEPAADNEQLLDKMFFRLIDLVHLMGGDLDLLLPPLEDILTAPELAELASRATFHYRLKCGYQSLHAAQHVDN